MAPAPKPPGQRRRRNAGQAQWRALPAGGSGLEAPLLPVRESGWSERTVAWWRTVWASPMATAYAEADVDGLVRLAELREDFAAGRVGVAALPAIQQLEDRFGLSPKARRTLQWEIAAADGEASRSAGGVAEVRRLRAVDPRAVAG